MHPVGRELGDGAHNEPSLMRPGMRHHQARPIDDLAAMGDEVEIKRARRIPGNPLPVEGLFDGRKRLQNGLRGHRRLDKSDSVAILRFIRVGPGGGAPPAGPGQHGQSRRREARQGRLEERLGGGVVAGQVAPEGDDYRLLQLRGPDV